MEVNRWKNILTDWIIQTGFLQPSFSVLEDSNLEAFFRAYRLKVPKISEDNVYAFLKHTFPNFSFHHFDDEGLCSAEFVFVYSLLLHYGCVGCRDVHIQNACKALGEFQQAAVANFFKQFGATKYEAVGRRNLRKMIVDAMRTDDEAANVALATPNKRRSAGSPNTPKNRLLEQNIRELNKVRILLETERYEKGFLEIQVKEGQDQIKRMGDQQKVHIHEINELKNQLLYENDENKAPNTNDQERRPEVNAMKRNIGQLEDKVANLLVETHCLEADKGTLTKKLKHSEEQIQLLFERSEEIALLVDQLRNEVNEKTRSIADLTETNEQLQMMLNEYKSPGNPLDLNSTSDFSFSKHSDHDSETSGNNLAKSVIDIQLKEKQLENEKLREQIHQMTETKLSIESEIEEFMNNNDFSADESVQDDRTEGLLDCLLNHFSATITDMDRMKVRMEEKANELVQQKESLDQEIAKLEAVIFDKSRNIENLTMDLERVVKSEESVRMDSQAELEDLRGNCNNLLAENDNLNVENRSFQATIKTLEEDIFIKVNELRELNTRNERHLDKYNKLKYEHDNSNRAVAELNAELESQRRELDNLHGDYDKLKEKNGQLEKDYEEMVAQLKLNIKALEEEMEEKQRIAKELQDNVKQLKENNSIIEEVTACLNEEIQLKNNRIGELETEARKSSDALKELEDKLEENESDLQEKLTELEEMKEANRKSNEMNEKLIEEKRILEGEMETQSGLIGELEKTVKEVREDMKNIQSQLAEIKDEKATLEQNLIEYNSDREKIKDEFINCQLELGDKIISLEKHIEDLEQELSVKSDQISSLTTSLEKQEADCLSKSEELQALSAEKSQIQSAMDERSKELEDKIVLVNSLEEKLNVLSAEISAKSESIADQEQSLKTLQEMVDSKSQEIDSLIRGKSQLEEEMAKMADSLNEKTNEIDTLNERITEINNNLVVKAEIISSLETDKTDLQQSLDSKSKEIEDISPEKSRLESELIHHSKEIGEKSTLIDSLEKQIEELSTEAAEKSDTISSLESNLKDLQEVVLSKSEEIEILTAEKAHLETEKARSLHHTAELEEEIRESVVMIHDLEEELKKNDGEINRLEEQLEDKKNDLEEKAREIDSLEMNWLIELRLKEEADERYKNAQTITSQKNERIATLEAELKEQTEEKLNLEQTIASMNEDILNKSVNITNLQSEVVNIKDTIEELGNTIASLNEEIHDKTVLIAKKDGEIDEVQHQLKELEGELEAVKKEKTDLANNFQDEKEDYEKTISNANEQIEELRTGTIERDEMITLERNTVGILNIEKAELMKEIEEQKTENHQKESTIQILQKSLQEFEETSQNLQSQLTNSQEAYQKVLQQIAEKSEAAIHQEVEIGELKSLTEEMDKNIGELHEKLIEKTTQIVGLETRVAEVEAEREELHSQLLEVTKDGQAKEESLQKMQEIANQNEAEVDKLTKIVAEEKASKDNLKQELSEKEVDLSIFKDSVEQLYEEKKSLQLTIQSMTEDLSSAEEKSELISQQMVDACNQISALEEEGNKIHKECDGLIIQLEAQKEIVKAKAAEIDRLNETVERIELAVSSKENLISAMKEVEATHKSEIAELIKEKEAICEDLNAAKQMVQEVMTTLDKEVAEEKAIKAELEEKLNAKDAELKDLKNSLQESSEEKDVEIDRLRADLVEKDNSITELNEQIQATSANLTALAQERQSQIENMDRQLAIAAEKEKALVAEFTSRAEQFQREISELSAVKVDLEEKERKITEEMASIVQEKDTAIAKIEEYKSSIETIEATAIDKEASLQSELEALKEEKILLNSELSSLKDQTSASESQVVSLTEEIYSIKSQLTSKVDEYNHLADIVEKKQICITTMEQENRTLQEDKATLNNLISKLTQENQVVELQLGECEKKLSEINREYGTLKSRHSDALDQLEKELEEVKAERKSLFETNKQHEIKMVELNAEIVGRERKISLLMTDLHKNEMGQMEESSKINLLLNKIESYKTDEVKLQELENLHHREKEINKKLTTDVEILCAKLAKNRKEKDEMEKGWQEEKRELAAKLSSVTSGQQSADERMKDYRLEMEGKLEKMKEKMKTLYNEEMGKLKHKHERDLFEVRKEIVAKDHQVQEYDTQCRKLAKQIRQLNERQLDMYKENEFMKCRLKVGGDLQRSALGGSHRMLPPSSSMLSVANLKMEDEEGEVFNNTYLIDLKNGGGALASGRTSPSRESICLSELQHRNSMVPRHLRSTYTVQYGDQGYKEEDLLHGNPLGLDDSMSSLLNTDKRKKVGGTTSYKRPGPPTPSKNGGRLSFGGTGGSVVGRLSFGALGYDNLNPREALKEFQDNENNRKVTGKETPGKTLTSFFSNSSKVRNENATPKKRLSIFRNKK